MGQDFSGSCAVTSRNSLIQKGATTATKSELFRPKRGAPGSFFEGLTLRRGVACYCELPRIPLPRTRVNRGKKKEGRVPVGPRPSWVAVGSDPVDAARGVDDFAVYRSGLTISQFNSSPGSP